MMVATKNKKDKSLSIDLSVFKASLLTGQIDVENPDMNYRLLNIESTVTCKHHMQDMAGCYCREGDS